MNGLKQFYRRSFWIVTVAMLVVAAGIGAGVYWGLNRLSTQFDGVAEQPQLLERLPFFVEWLQAGFMVWVLPAITGVLLLAGWVLWLVLRLGTAGMILETSKTRAPESFSAKSGKKDFLDQKIEQERRQRLFLHTLGVLQREGRLLDFFAEDLKNYSDDQIGAAVRSIQADCKQAVKKYIDPGPVVAGDEGDPITIAPGFDMNAVALVGNVAGDPPFEGVIRHRGWKAGRKEVPRLADIQDPTIITPAEIEVKAGT